MSRSRQQPKGKFKSENFKGTLGCASSKGDVQGKRELNPDTGALAERKGFHAFSIWKEKSTTPQKNSAYSGACTASAFSHQMDVQGLITAGGRLTQHPSAQPKPHQNL